MIEERAGLRLSVRTEQKKGGIWEGWCDMVLSLSSNRSALRGMLFLDRAHHPDLKNLAFTYQDVGVVRYYLPKPTTQQRDHG